MLTVEEAVAQVLTAGAPVCEPETVPLERALGRILAEPNLSPVDVPRADNSAMDGYALRAADWPGPDAALPVAGRVPAGRAPAPLPPGAAVRIFTGAELPEGADTVVMQEHCRADDERVVIETLPSPADRFVRPRGQDMQSGEEILAAGTPLRAPALGLLAATGQATVRVRRPLRVALLSNGDELREPGEPLGPGQVYNANRALLGGVLRGWGFEVVDLEVAVDDPADIAARLEDGAARADAVLCSGGVSVGEEDHVKDVVARLGSLSLWKIAMKPGKPLAFGRVGDVPFVGLPGNPASALVTCLIIARPLLFARQGREDRTVRPLAVPAAFDRTAESRQVYLRVRREEGGLALYPNQSSGVLRSAAWADGLAVQAPNTPVVAGSPLPFLPFSALT